ncbi:hypothetical protein ACS0TY_022400 [Phlomoides rotata]
MSHHHRSSPLPSCLRPPSSSSAAANPNLTTCIYNTDVGLFALSWCRNRFGRSLHLHHHHHDLFRLRINSFPFFCNKQGSKKINLIAINKQATILWDLSGAKYGSGPEPESGFYITIVVDGEIILCIGDSVKQAHSKIAAALSNSQSPMILRREHVYGTKPYSTKAVIGGKEREISIECRLVKDPRLYVSIDDKRVLQIKHLKWKFRGSESVEIDGNYVQVSWDVYNWLFDERHRNHSEDGYALFMFTIFTQREEGSKKSQNLKSNCNGILSLPQIYNQQNSLGLGFEEKKMMKKKKKGGLLRRGGRSSSFSSFSSANSSSSCSSSVMEWADNEDDEFMDYPYSGFSLLVYAWRT